MLIDVDESRYTKITRRHVMTLLEQAQLAPDKLTMHRDRTITASYLRERETTFEAGRYEARMEALDNRIAIFKRPSALDRGRYLTLTFAVASKEQLGLPDLHDAAAQNGKSNPPEGSIAVMGRLHGVSRDMQQLTRYAKSLAAKNKRTHENLFLTLEEMQRQIDILQEGLQQLEATQKPRD